ncbi:Pimeloyl-ACP methyl ester carboxylesterase [Sphingomonas gellani]|uniref:Pimeloyl-ACP methyl ester carboxylesterase n=2 Tax=Sphingomonas gellani TaxID=1166340 RepID=A0A1H8IPL9_9SPHN|nr:Pimeloyl-ACP methyl ester carboxylesterase [Sphingomonas gellani]
MRRPTIHRLAAIALACGLFSPSALAQTTAMPKAKASMPDTVQMEHISIRTIGRGAPVILIPGLSSPRAAWDDVAPELAKEHSVLLVQVNGFGGGDPRGNLAPGVLDGIVADLHATIVQRRLNQPAIIGHSMGGLVGLMLAARHPTEVGKLMMVDSLPFFAATMAPPGVAITVAMVEPRAAQMRDAVAASYGKAPDPAAAAAQVAGMTLNASYRPRLTEWAMRSDPRVAARAMYEDLTTDIRPELPKVRAPVTVVYAWNDTYPRKEPAEAFFRQQFAGTATIDFKGIGPSAHFVMFDQSAQFQQVAGEFLAR